MTKLRVADRWAIFNLPWQVAKEEGDFEREGLEVEFAMSEAAPRPDARRYAPELFGEGRAKERAFHLEAAIDTYNTCEWGAIKRTHEGERPGKIIGLRSSIVDMAIVASPRSKIYALRDLADVPIHTSFYNGDHFLILELLEGPLGLEHVKPVHSDTGGYQERARALVAGEIQAGTFMEPYLSLVEKNGGRVIAETYFRGAEVGSPDLDAATIGKIFRALGVAVRRVNQDLGRYVPRFVEEANRGAAGLVPITAADFRVDRLRYVEPEPYPEDEFQRTYSWMVAHDLVAPGARYDDLVRAV